VDQERLVEERLRAVLRPYERLYPNVRWIAPSRPGGPPRNGESDLVLVAGERGMLLVIETKSGPIRRDGFGRWHIVGRDLDQSPFRQAETGAHALADKIRSDPEWRGAPLREIQAVAFPEVDRVSIGGQRELGPDEPRTLIIDRADLSTEATARRALSRILDFWSGDGSRDRAFSEAQLATIDEVLSPEVRLRPLLRGDIEAGEHEMFVPTHHQLKVLDTLRGEPRASIVGGAGSGKTLVAVEKARRLAREGFNVLLVCYNQPLAGAFATNPDLVPLIAGGRVIASTFHELCRRLGAEAGTLPPQPEPPGREWFDVELPKALDRAIETVGGRWQAVVVDEGQDFDAGWLTSLDMLTSQPGEDVFYLFHDPSQALFRPDAAAAMGLHEYPLLDNCRNARPIHELAYRFYDGGLDVEPMREDGRTPEIIVAEPGEPTVAAVRDLLHRLVVDEGVEREQIAVLTGTSLERSAVWHQRRFKGDLVLWNGGVDDTGHTRGLGAGAVAAQPPRTILCETIHRFKGLERDVVVLVELRPDDERLRQLLYIGITRARHHVALVVVPEVAARLQRGAS
jgi:hypothetical protein